MSQHFMGGRRINKISLPALPYPNIRQKQRSGVYSSVFYLWQMTGSQGRGGISGAHRCPGWLRSRSKALPWGEQQPPVRPGPWCARAHVPARWRARTRVPGLWRARTTFRWSPRAKRGSWGGDRISTAGEDTGGKTRRWSSIQKWSLGQWRDWPRFCLNPVL